MLNTSDGSRASTKKSWSPRGCALEIPNPCFLRREPQNLLSAPSFVDRVRTEAPSYYEGAVRGHLARTLKELSLLQRAGKEEGTDERELVPAQRNSHVPE